MRYLKIQGGDKVKKYFERLCLLLLIFFVYSCASQPVAPPEWRYEKEAIGLHVKADSQLNLYEGMPHTLLICAYQLRDPNTFNQLTEDDDGLYELLDCSRFDASVASSRRLIIHPGQDLTFVLDRAEGGKYVALVAGYYLLKKEGMVRLFDVPVVVEKKGWIKRTKIAKPGPLSIEVTLGAQSIQKAGDTVQRVRGK
jgi:type VI secretion system VasD/TssJ family lipoprotein